MPCIGTERFAKLGLYAERLRWEGRTVWVVGRRDWGDPHREPLIYASYGALLSAVRRPGPVGSGRGFPTRPATRPW